MTKKISWIGKSPGKRKLRTLKDLEIETEDGDIYSSTLRYEAEKYIEDLNEHIKKTYPGEKLNITEGEMAREVMRRTITFIKHFFNIDVT